MAFDSLREYMDRLEKEGELMRIKTEVDWNFELGAIMRRANDLRQPALLFEKIKDYPQGYRVFSNGIGATKPNIYGRLCIALGLPKETPPLEIIDEIVRRFTNQIKPVLVDNGPCKENIIKGNEVDLLKLPVPFFRPVDGGRYIGTWHGTVTKDPDSGWVNWGMYRHMLHDKRSIGWLVHPGTHGGTIFYQKYEARGKTMPMAIVIGASPACALASMSAVSPYVDEVDIAGGLNGKPVELVKCETIDLEVPATAEIVLEGEVRPNERKDEGPFGEFTGYRASEKSPRPVFHVNCITHRNNPILTVAAPGKPFDDQTFNLALFNSAAITVDLKKLGLPFKSLFVTSSLLGVIVSASEIYPGYVHTLSSAIWSTRTGTYRPTIIVVGEDVDVTNMEEVIWALTTRMHPDRDIHIRKGTPTQPLYPFLSSEEKARYSTGATVCFDATFPYEWKEATPQVIDFEHAWSTETQQLVMSRWKEYGFK